jgi:hypothetical protein
VRKKALQAGLNKAFLRSMQAVIRFTSGISELQSRNASGVHAASSSDEAALTGVPGSAKVSAMTAVNWMAMGNGEKITRVLLDRGPEERVHLLPHGYDLSMRFSGRLTLKQIFRFGEESLNRSVATTSRRLRPSNSRDHWNIQA